MRASCPTTQPWAAEIHLLRPHSAMDRSPSPWIRAPVDLFEDSPSHIRSSRDRLASSPAASTSSRRSTSPWRPAPACGRSGGTPRSSVWLLLPPDHRRHKPTASCKSTQGDAAETGLAVAVVYPRRRAGRPLRRPHPPAPLTAGETEAPRVSRCCASAAPACASLYFFY